MELIQQQENVETNKYKLLTADYPKLKVGFQQVFKL